MTLVDREIINGNNEQIKSLQDVTENSKKLIEVIRDFIAESKDKLTGEGYERVRERLEFYLSALETQQKLSEIVKNNFTVGNNLMIDFMEDFNNLDDSDLDSIRATLSWVDSNISSLQERIGLLTQEDGSEILKSLRTKLYEWKNLLTSYTKLTEKLECLSNTDNSILQYLSDTYDDCNKFLEAVQQIQVAEIK